MSGLEYGPSVLGQVGAASPLPLSGLPASGHEAESELMYNFVLLVWRPERERVWEIYKAVAMLSSTMVS